MLANSSNSSVYRLLYYCFDSRVSVLTLDAFMITKFLLVFPLYIFVFYLGHQRRRRQQQQRSTTTTSHSDFFTYHMAAMELTSLVFFIIYLCGKPTTLTMMTKVGFFASRMVFTGQMLFHILTCMERYMAVVHPVTYMSLRRSAGVRIRNINAVCVWLLCFGWIGVMALYDPNFPMIPFVCNLVFSILVVSFCSLSVLRVLIRPRPGEVGGVEEQVDQSKQRAFHMVTAIMAVLWLWFVGLLVCIILDASTLFSSSDGCVVMASGIWFSLPSSLVLPLLYLHRAGKPLCRSVGGAEAV